MYLKVVQQKYGTTFIMKGKGKLLKYLKTLGPGLITVGISPMKVLIFTAIRYDVTSPVLITAVPHIGNNKKIMNGFTNTRLSKTLGIVTFILMTLSAVLLIYFQFKS